MLYIVPTPIGNLKDITLRALEVLKTVDKVLAEDTRQTRKLFDHYEIETPLAPYHMHNEHRVLELVINELKAGVSIALVSDAGTPGISDPGFLLTRACNDNDIKIDALPGSTAFVPALLKSGFPCDRFIFEGFLPHKKGKQTRVKEIAEQNKTVVLYESPHRLVKTLQMIQEIIGDDTIVSVSRELTKMYEETVTDIVPNVLKHFSEKTVKGEIVIVVKRG